MKYAALEELNTEHLRLRKVRLSDASDYYLRLGGCEDVTRFMLWQPHGSLEESTESIRKILARYKIGNAYTWAIALRENDTMIGRIDLLRIDETESSCSFAYMLGTDFWGQGFGTECLKAVFEFAFEKLQMNTIIADHMSENIASGKAMQKAGMYFTARHTAKYEKNGIIHNAEEYKITFDQWKNQISRSG